VDNDVQSLTLQQLQDELVRTSAAFDAPGEVADVERYWAVREELQRRIADHRSG